jgi:DNA-binding XRE family transcriptional regulator
MNDALADRLARARADLFLTQEQAAHDAQVAVKTIAAAEAGRPLRPITVQRLEKWLMRAERRLERRVSRS